MKKTTIRAVGFLFVAACVALLASCNQSTTPVESKKKAPPPFMAQFKGVWKLESWMGSDPSSSNKAYYFVFDKDGQLRLAYDPNTSALSNDDIITRAATVAVEAEGADKIKIEELQLANASKFKLEDDKITITVGPGARIILKKVTKLADIDSKATDIDFFTKDIKDRNPETVVYNFNKNVLNLNSCWEPSISTAWKITKLHGKTPNKKKAPNDSQDKEYYLGFASTVGKYIVSVDQTAGKHRTQEASYSITYTLGDEKMKITVDALGLKDVPFTHVQVSGNGTLTIGKDEKTETKLVLDSSAYSTIAGSTYTEDDKVVTKAIANFDKQEE